MNSIKFIRDYKQLFVLENLQQIERNCLLSMMDYFNKISVFNKFLPIISIIFIEIYGHR